MEIQLQAALAGNGLSELPRARLQRVALLLGLTASDFARLESLLRFRQGMAGAAGAGAGAGADARRQRMGAGRRARSACAGLWPARGHAEMSDEEIVKAYRRQMSRHHPDKLKANGLPRVDARARQGAHAADPGRLRVIRERRGMR